MTAEFHERNDGRDPAERKGMFLRYAYGMDLDQYEAILEFQDDSCAICGDRCKSERNLAVDHDHMTGDVRGLLCLRCNVALGHFRDDPAILQAAIHYLANPTAPLALYRHGVKEILAS